MIAHPERNKDVLRNLENPYIPLVELGCLLQVTTGSIVGLFGEGILLRTQELLEMGVVIVLASDAHHINRRPVNLSAGFISVAAVVGEVRAKYLVYNNPLAIVGSQLLIPA